MNVLGSLGAICVLGIGAQWLAWRVRIPAILILLSFGIVAGQAVTGILDPDKLFGDLLLPGVSLAVAVILFEGGLSLQIRELRALGGVIIALLTIGSLTAGVLTALAARWLLGMPWETAILLGAILIVTGPTVIGPLLRHLRLSGNVAAILRWEGIVIDPIGASLAVLVFETILASSRLKALEAVLIELAAILVCGGLTGLLAAALLVLSLARRWVPDHLETAVTLMFVIGAFTLSNLIQAESGLLTVTLMGMSLANQRWVSVQHLLHFKEQLSVLLISVLFIVLSSRLGSEHLKDLNLGSIFFLLALFLVVRPASVFLATIGSRLTWRERLFLAWMAPRGIVAASVASVFALELASVDGRLARGLVPITFLVIVSTVAVYGLTAGWLAVRLGLIHPNPQGVLLVGAHPWARQLALALQRAGIPVLLVDTDWAKISAARMAGLPVQFGNVLSEWTIEQLDLGGFRRLVALTANEELNALACQRFAEFFGWSEVYHLPLPQGPGQHAPPTPGTEEGILRPHAAAGRSRFLLDPGLTFGRVNSLVGEDPQVKVTRLTPEFDFAAFQKQHGTAVVPVFLLQANGALAVFAHDNPPIPTPGDTVIALVRREPASDPSEPTHLQ